MICPGRRESKETQLTHCDSEFVSSDSSFEPIAEGNEGSDSSLIPSFVVVMKLRSATVEF